MKEQLISFETAKLARSKGYHLINDSDLVYDLKDGKLERADRLSYDCIIPAPTLCVTQKWLREVHNLHVWCIPNNDPKICTGYVCFVDGLYAGDSTYEAALEQGLQKALILLPNVPNQTN